MALSHAFGLSYVSNPSNQRYSGDVFQNVLLEVTSLCIKNT